MNWNRWSGSVGTPRLGVLLGVLLIATAAWTVGFEPSGTTTVLPLVGGVMLFYSALLALLCFSARQRARPRRRVAGVALIMIGAVAGVAQLTGSREITVLLLLPVLHGALQPYPRDAALVAVICALLWLVMPGFGTGLDWASVVQRGFALAPVGLMLLLVQALAGQVATAQNRITALSYRDELTGLLNMRAFTRMLQSEHAKWSANSGHYALIMVDIDRLQVFNDRFGHEQGNRVIVAVADAIRRSTRNDDFVARYGGDEFIVFLPGATDDVAEVVSNRIAQQVYNITLSFDRSTQRVSVNSGRAIFPDSGKDIQAMMSFADRAMYRDKEFRRSTANARPAVDNLKRQAGVHD